jgi:hypothetical protein
MRKIRAIPPAPSEAVAFPRYFPASDFTPAEIETAEDAGHIKPWRENYGVMWFARADELEQEPDEPIEDSAEIDANRAAWRYSKLVESRARGVDVPRELGLAICADAGKSEQAFFEDVATCMQLDAEIEADGA